MSHSLERNAPGGERPGRDITNDPLSKRRLGRTGFRVTPLGLGGAHLGRTPDGLDDAVAVATVLRALELGINLIDTAPLYGDSQRRIGMALQEWYRQGGQREDLIISTKTGRDAGGRGDYSAQATRRSVEESLRLLRTDYIDILLVHDPDDLTPVLAPGGTLDVLKDFKRRGLIRAIGLGVRSHEFHRRCIETGEFDVLLTFCDYNLLNQSAATGVLEPAAAKDVGVLNGAAVLLGLLSGRDPRTVKRHLQLGAYELWQWTQEHGYDLLALNLQFCLRERRIHSTLVGAATPEEIQTDVRAIYAEIQPGAWEELHARFGILMPKP